MKTGKGYITKVPEAKITPAAKVVIQALASDLQQILKANSDLSDIVLRGGGAYDILLGLEPNDIDLFYSYKSKTSECKCEDVKNAIHGLTLSYIQGKSIDLENSYEKEPRLEPIERTVGHFSYHSDYNSMFVIDQFENVWTNIHALKYFEQGVYEIRYEGMLPWAYFPHEGDSADYFASQCYNLVRGLGYIIKRRLTPGESFTELLLESEYLVEQGIQRDSNNRLKNYCAKKLPDKEKAVYILSTFELGDSKDSVIQAFKTLFTL